MPTRKPRKRCARQTCCGEEHTYGVSFRIASDASREVDRVRKARSRANASVEAAAATRERNAAQHRQKRIALIRDAAMTPRREDAPKRGGYRWWEALPPRASLSPIRLDWGGVCATCGVQVRASGSFLAMCAHLRQVLSGDSNACFVCGPNGAHLLDRLPAYPPEWSVFIDSPNLGGLSRKLNNLFCLTAMGIYDGEWMKFDSGVASVTLAGGRTYHRMIPADSGEHPLRWMVYDMETLRSEGTRMELSDAWVSAALEGLQAVNPYIRKLANLSAVPDDDSQLALHLDLPTSVSTSEVAAVVSIAPACIPTPRKYVIRFRGETEHRFLASTSPLIEPLHYPLLLPYGTLGWRIGLQYTKDNNFTQMRWFRSRYYMNASQMSRFSRLAGEFRAHAHMLHDLIWLHQASTWSMPGVW
jgi:hypothetical protein